MTEVLRQPEILCHPSNPLSGGDAIIITVISFSNLKQWLSEFHRYRPTFKPGYWLPKANPNPKPTPENLLPEPVFLLLGAECYPSSRPIEVPYATAVQSQLKME